MRVKEGSDDYRYFPEPDLLDFILMRTWKERIRAEIPELPDARQKRYVEELGLPAYDADVLTVQKKWLISLKQRLLRCRCKTCFKLDNGRCFCLSECGTKGIT